MKGLVVGCMAAATLVLAAGLTSLAISRTPDTGANQIRPILAPPVGGAIWGDVDASILGDCSADVHDRYVVAGGDGYRYRTWHPQEDPSGCVFGHEHGDDPASMSNEDIAASPVRFGYIGRRHQSADEPLGHQEAHEGFKVFIAQPGEVNDERRVNRVFSRSVFHMGTGGPKRFSTAHHSAEIRIVHPEFDLVAFTQLMMDTGGVGAVCDPRARGVSKDVMQVNSPCRLSSPYEIWQTQASVWAAGREVYRAFATPAVFDPITVFDRTNPSAVIYAWAPLMAASMRFPENDWSGNRGCDRESYAQPGYWYNAGGEGVYYTDAMGSEVSPDDPGALTQVLSVADRLGVPATRDGLAAFKIRRNYCSQADKLGLKN